MVVTPAVGSPLSSWRAESERKGRVKLVVCPQVSNGLALKICIPLIKSTTKQIALTQWQTRTSAECLAMSRPSGAARPGRAEESDVNAKSPIRELRPRSSIRSHLPGVSRRNRDFCWALFLGVGLKPGEGRSVTPSRQLKADETTIGWNDQRRRT